MTAIDVRNSICAYFGGVYDPTSRSYRTPQIAGLGAVRRAAPKRMDAADFTLGQPAGTANGSIMIVYVPAGSEHRVAVAGATSGIKQVDYTVGVELLIRSTAGYAEDAQDYAYTLLDAVIAHIRTDRTCGTGGFEAGGLQVGEGESPRFDWAMSPPETSAEVTKLTVWLELDAREYVYA